MATGKERRAAEKALASVPAPKLRAQKEIEAKLRERVDARNKAVAMIEAEQKQVAIMEANIKRNTTIKNQMDGMIDALVFTLQGSETENEKKPESPV